MATNFQGLPVAIGLTGAEIVPITQAGVDKRTTTGAIAVLTSAGGVVIGASTISGGTNTRILYDNSGVFGEYSLTGSGTVVAMQTSPVFVTPTLGVATATSIAINAATIGPLNFNGELEISNTSNNNVAAVRQDNPTAFAAVCFKDGADEHAAFGYHCSGVGGGLANTAFWEGSNFDGSEPPTMYVIQTGQVGPDQGQFRRLEFNSNGRVGFFKYNSDRCFAFDGGSETLGGEVQVLGFGPITDVTSATTKVPGLQVTSNAGAYGFICGPDVNHSMTFRQGIDGTADVLDFYEFGQFRWWNGGVVGSMTLKMSLTSVGNLKIGGTASRGTTEGTNQLVLFNGTAPVGTLTNGASFYAASGEMRVMDAAGNSTLLSPHDQETNEWIYHSFDTRTGKGLRIDMERMLRAINERFGWDFVHEFQVSASLSDLPAAEVTT